MSFYQPPYQTIPNDNFAPPPGPPPGWGDKVSAHDIGGHYHTPSPYQPPTSNYSAAGNPYHDPYNAPQSQANHHNNGNHLAPYPIQQRQQQHQRPHSSGSSWQGQPNSRPTSMSMIYPPSMHCWTYTDSNMGTYVEFGSEPIGEPLFSGKVRLSTGKVTFRRQKFKRNGEHLGEGKNKSALSSKYVIHLPSGSEVPYDSHASFEFPYRGANEKWTWGGIAGQSTGSKIADKLTQKVTGKEQSMQLTGQTSGAVAAVVTAKGGDFTSSISKKPIGLFEFKRPVVSGELGSEFATIALMAFMKERQKAEEKKAVKALIHVM